MIQLYPDQFEAVTAAVKRAIPSTFKDMAGLRFGKIIVLSIGARKNGVYWNCRCDCGTETLVKGTSLRLGKTRSCGCGAIEQAIKNGASSRLKKMVPYPHSKKMKDLYSNIVNRCENSSNKRWENYGGKGVKMYPEWRGNRRLFYKWCYENGYAPGLQIDRINVHGNYEPGNCRFVNAIVQMNNTTRNKLITWDGQTYTVAEWAKKLGTPGRAFQSRVDRDWRIARIFAQLYRKPKP